MTSSVERTDLDFKISVALLPSICRSVTYILWSSDFASYLGDYLMEKRCTLDNGSLWLKDRPCKIYVGQWPIFHGPLILPYIIVRLILFLYIKKWHRLGVFVPLRALALVNSSYVFLTPLEMEVQHFMYFTRFCTLLSFWVYTPLLYQYLTFCTKLHHSNREETSVFT